MHVASPYASHAALCETARVGARIISVQKLFSKLRVRSPRLELSTSDGGMFACRGTYECVVNILDALKVAGLANRNMSED